MAFTASNGRTQTSLSDINITPLVDVVLVLLIIFMVTAPVLQSGIEVSVPKTRTVKEITEERLVISIDKQQRVFLGNDPININEIAAKLQQKIRDPQHQSIFIRADEDVPFGAFATVMDAVKQSGITNVSIVTQPLRQSWKPTLRYFSNTITGAAIWRGRLGCTLRLRAAIVLYAVIATGPWRRHLGRWRRRGRDGSDPGQHGSAACESGADAECSGERIQGIDAVAAED